MKALVFTAPGAVELRDVPEPTATDGEIVVTVRAAGVCGSELHGVRQPGFRVPPLIMGHEFAGLTHEGTPVAVNPLLSCGSCDLCERGARQICRKRRIIGVHLPGGFAERVAVPRSALRPVQPDLPFTSAALAEPAANAVHAWARSGAQAGQRIAVIGCGAIGLFCLLAAAHAGANRIHAADLARGRRDVASRLGAAAGTDLDGEFDVIFDAVGSAATRAASLDRLAPGGTAVWLGLAESEPGFDGNALVRGERQVLGSFGYTDAEFRAALDLVARWDLGWATAFPLAAGERVFKTLLDGGTDPVKAVLIP